MLPVGMRHSTVSRVIRCIDVQSWSIGDAGQRFLRTRVVWGGERVYGVGMTGGGVELDPAVDIEERLRTVCGHLNVLNAQLVELAGEALTSGSWQGHGVKSLAHWLTWQAGISAGHAREVVRLAEAKESHPQVMAVFADGRGVAGSGGDRHHRPRLSR